MIHTRRKFIKNVSAATMLTPLALFPLDFFKYQEDNGLLNMHLFSKHLHFLSIGNAAEIAKELGFCGLDLTVRPKGHVLPENVENDLPKAIKKIKSAGIRCEMITTAISDIAGENDLKIIKTAAEQSIKFYRCDWFKYHENKSMQNSIAFYQKKFKN